MRRVVVSGFVVSGFVLIGLTAIAVGADLPVKTPSVYTPVSAYNWTGFYAGAHLGGIGGYFRNDPGIAGPIDKGGSLMGGLQAGYNWQSNQFVFGGEADISAISVRASSATNSFKENWMSTLRARGGYAFGAYLAYLTAGVAFTHSRVDNPIGSSSTTQAGFTAGAGLEAFLTPNWTARAEYLYVDVPKHTYLIGATTTIAGSANHVGRVAANYKF